jgi:hypothetical protein
MRDAKKKRIAARASSDRKYGFCGPVPSAPSAPGRAQMQDAFATGALSGAPVALVTPDSAHVAALPVQHPPKIAFP